MKIAASSASAQTTFCGTLPLFGGNRSCFLLVRKMVKKFLLFWGKRSSEVY
jgi:hypothetical protein